VNGHTLTAGVEFNSGANAADTANNLAIYIQSHSGTLGVNAAVDTGTTTKVNITANTAGADGNSNNLATTKGAATSMSGGSDGTGAVAADTITIDGQTLTAGTDFTIDGSTAATVINLANYIQTNSGMLGLTSAVDCSTNTKINLTASGALTINSLSKTGDILSVDGSTYSFLAGDADEAQHQINIGIAITDTAANLAAALGGDTGITAAAGSGANAMSSRLPRPVPARPGCHSGTEAQVTPRRGGPVTPCRAGPL
jgi:hypothetical protein